MKHALYRPVNPQVGQIVQCMGYVEMSVDDPEEGWFGLFPNGSSNLTLSLSDEPVHYNNNSGKSLLYAAWHSPAAIKRSSELSFMNVQLKPFGIHTLTGIRMSELLNTSLNLDDLFSPASRDELVDHVMNADTLNKKFRLVENFLADNLKTERMDDRVAAAIQVIDSPGTSELDDVCRAVCLSPRRLRELFRDHVGFNPVVYNKLKRFNRAVRIISSDSYKTLTDVAFSAGYFDQSHFIKDFKFFAGITPSAYQKRKAQSADFYNFNLTDLSNFA